MQKTHISILFILLTALLLAGTGTAAVTQEAYCPGQILVQYDADAAASLPAVEILYNFSSLVPGLQLIRIPDGMTVEDAVAYYERIPGVVFAEPDYLRIPAAIEEPDDPYFEYQWHLNNTGPGQKILPYTKRPDDYEQPETAVAGADIQALDAWNITNGSKDILVGVIDTGVMYTHEDLRDNIWTNPDEIPNDGIDNDGNGYIDDIHGWNFGENNSNPMDYAGHGTHCAGIIGAVANNGIGVTGVSPNVTIMPLKAVDNQGLFSSSGILQAIEYGSKMGVRIFSCSYGSYGIDSYSRSEYLTIAAAEDCLFVCSAGNNQYNVDYAKTFHYPSGYNLPNILCVAATAYDDKLDASYSNYGVRTVHVASPGTNILSTVPDGVTAKYDTTTDMEWYEYQNDTSRFAVIRKTIEPIELDENNDTIISFWIKYDLTGNAEAGSYITDKPFESYQSLDEMKKDAALISQYTGSGQKETVAYLTKEWIKSVNGPVYLGIAFSTDDTESGSQFMLARTMNVLGRANDPESAYESYDGTSMATPVVSGTAALVLSQNPDLTPVQLKELIMASVEKNDNLRDKVASGGRVNVYLSVNNSIPRLSEMQIVPKKITLSTGSTYLFAEPTGYDQFDREFVLHDAEWSSSNPEIAAVNATTGVLYATSPGKVTITASWDELSADAVVTVTNAEAGSIVVRPGTTYTAGSAGTFVAYVYDTNGKRIPNYPVVWSSSDPGVLQVDELTGNYIAFDAGDVTITADAGDGLTEEVDITVNPAPGLVIDAIRFTPDPITLMEGTPVPVIATAMNTSTNTTFPNAAYDWDTDKEDVVEIMTQDSDHRMATLTLLKTGEEPFFVSVDADNRLSNYTGYMNFDGEEQ